MSCFFYQIFTYSAIKKIRFQFPTYHTFDIIIPESLMSEFAIKYGYLLSGGKIGFTKFDSFNKCYQNIWRKYPNQEIPSIVVLDLDDIKGIF